MLHLGLYHRGYAVLAARAALRGCMDLRPCDDPVLAQPPQGVPAPEMMHPSLWNAQ